LKKTALVQSAHQLAQRDRTRKKGLFLSGVEKMKRSLAKNFKQTPS